MVSYSERKILKIDTRVVLRAGAYDVIYGVFMYLFMVLIFIAAHLCAAALMPRISRALIAVPGASSSSIMQRKIKR